MAKITISPESKLLYETFFRAFLSGAVSAIAATLPFAAKNLDELYAWGVVAMFAGITGGVNGLIQALKAWLNLKNKPIARYYPF